MNEQQRNEHKEAVIGKLEAHGLTIASPWEEIEKVLLQTVLPEYCIGLAKEMKEDHDNREVVKTWEMDGFKLELFWDLGPTANGSHLIIPFRFYDNDKLIFDTEINCPRGIDYIETDYAIANILGFVTLRPGDTDPDYFDWYTQNQKDWRDSSRCEQLSIDAIDLVESY